MHEEHQHHTGESHEAAAHTESPAVRHSIFDKVSYFLLIGLAFLLPIFVIPSGTISVDASKAWLLGGVVLVLLAVNFIGFILGKKTIVPRSTLYVGVASVVLTTLLSALFSDERVASLLGSGYHVGTASTIALLAILAYLSVNVFRTHSRVFSFYLTLLASFGVVALYQLIRLVGGADTLSFGVFDFASFSPVGKWNDLAVFSGLALLISSISLYYFKANKLVLNIGVVAIVLSLYFLTIIDFWILWLVLGAMFLIFFFYANWRKDPESHRMRFIVHKTSYLFIGLAVFSLLFGYGLRFPIGGSTVVSGIAQKIGGTSFTEIVLPPGPTLDITTSALKEHPIFGVGPNKFAQAYFLDKPEGINSTPLWDSSFDAGFSHLMTFITTGGVLGGLAWLVLIVGLAIAIRKAFALRGKDRVVEYLAISSAFVAFYLWVIAGIYLPNVAIMALAFISLGILTSVLVHEGSVRAPEVALASRNGWGVASVPVIVLAVIATSLWGYFLIGSLRADMYYQEARQLANQGNMRGAIEKANLAISTGERDAYDRLLTDLHLLELQRILSEVPSSEDELRRKVAELVNGATVSADAAIAQDPTNYLNHISKASISDLLATININRDPNKPEADSAKAAYAQALAYNPESPRIYFALARMDLLTNNRVGAKHNLEMTLKLRPGYPEAIAAYAELERQDGNLSKAIDAATLGFQSDPNNFVIAFQLGFLYYSDSKYPQAVAALESAVSTNPYYADAKYFLAISYARTGQKEKALKQFEEIQRLNTDNKEIKRVIENLKAGRDPLDDAR